MLKHKKTILFCTAGLLTFSILYPKDSRISEQKNGSDNITEMKSIHSESHTSAISTHQTKEIENQEAHDVSSLKDELLKNREKRMVAIDYGYIDDDVLSNIKSFNEVLNYTGINYQHNLEELHKSFQKASHEFNTNIDIIDPYGNIVSFKDCDTGLASSAYSNFNVVNGLGVVCNADLLNGEHNNATLRLIVNRKSNIEYIKIDETKPIEKNIIFNEDGTTTYDVINAIETETNVHYSMTYKYIDRENQQFYVGYITDTDNSGVVFETNSDGLFF